VRAGASFRRARQASPVTKNSLVAGDLVLWTQNLPGFSEIPHLVEIAPVQLTAQSRAAAGKFGPEGIGQKDPQIAVIDPGSILKD
jgi:hypothetical protein